MSQPSTPLLDEIKSPEDLRHLSADNLSALSEELRADMIDSVSVTGGHLGAGLGVVELTVALHYIFSTPQDRIIWDVGHQAYAHKILTGRRDRMKTLRQKGGLSGFTKRSESIYDPFGAGHSSTSISAGLGMAVAHSLNGDPQRNIVCVIGDGAMSAGMAYEAMNNAGAHDARLIVILNDNDMSIAPPVGAMSSYLARLVSSHPYRNIRERAKAFSKRLPKCLGDKARRSEELARSFLTGGTLFEELGFYYVGPIDGHNFDQLLPILKNVRDHPAGPVLIHVITQKGKGYLPAEQAQDKYHSVSSFNVTTGQQQKAKAQAPSYTNVFADTLIELSAIDEKIVAITAAMPSGTGLDRFGEKFGARMFDVGIAEQHGVTFAAGLAAEGFKPFVAIYSTFLQRGYDQIVHDVSIQNLPVRFAIDRAGFVGADGSTHAGSFDISFLTALPGFVVMAPSDEGELRHMVYTAACYDDGPISFRYPRGNGIGADLSQPLQKLEIGKGRIVKQGRHIAILALGTQLQEALAAAEILDDVGLSTTVADARFAKPLDQALVKQLASNHDVLITIEEGSTGGFSTQVLHYLINEDLVGSLKIRNLMLPDRYLHHGEQKDVLAEVGLDRHGIVKAVYDALGRETKSAREDTAT